MGQLCGGHCEERSDEAIVACDMHWQYLSLSAPKDCFASFAMTRLHLKTDRLQISKASLCKCSELWYKCKTTWGSLMRHGWNRMVPCRERVSRGKAGDGLEEPDDMQIVSADVLRRTKEFWFGHLTNAVVVVQ
jgi:hypothetical protein